ncbi:MAG: VOC family protein [Chloroflexota bacterium]|nr:VOC family protein [Chloroflexota bacterium]
MATAIDHVVIAVPDPDAAADELTERLGLAFTGGGRHPGLGTFNRIAFLGDAYLELIGVEDPDAALGWAVGRAAVRALDGGGGFATWALSDDNLAATVARLQASGSAIGPPVHGSRAGTGGELTEWWTATLPEVGPDLPPFLIQHAARGDEWGPRAMAARRTFVHPLGSRVRLASLELAVSDPIALAADCAAHLGLVFTASGANAAATLGPHRIQLGPTVAGHDWARLTLRGGAGPRRSATAFGVTIAIEPAP